MELENPPGIDVANLAAGTILLVRTQNSLYVVEIYTGTDEVLVSGGRTLQSPTFVNFPGSTWGGSCMKLKFIGRGMSMEFNYGGDRLLTSPVVDVRVILPLGWTYPMDWVAESL